MIDQFLLMSVVPVPIMVAPEKMLIVILARLAVPLKVGVVLPVLCGVVGLRMVGAFVSTVRFTVFEADDTTVAPDSTAVKAKTPSFKVLVVTCQV